MNKLLLDANLSPQTAKFLREFGFDVKSITEEKLGTLTDEEIVKMAVKEKRMIVTFDLDFGELYHSENFRKPGIIVLRIQNQTVENVNKALSSLLSNYQNKINKNQLMLIIVKENSIRFVE